MVSHVTRLGPGMVKLGANGRGYVRQAATDGLTTAMVLSLEDGLTRTRPFNVLLRVARVEPKPAAHQAGHPTQTNEDVT